MRDHYLISEDGRRTAVANLPTAEIVDCLTHGVEIVNDDRGSFYEKNILERMRIELVWRAIR